jgi:hypothetical protein
MRHRIASVRIELNEEPFATHLHDRVWDLYASALADRTRALTRPPNPETLAQQVRERLGPDAPLARALESKNLDEVLESRSSLLSRDVDEIQILSLDQLRKNRALTEAVDDWVAYAQSLEEEEPLDLEASYRETEEGVLARLRTQSATVKALLEAAAGRAPSFGTSLLRLEPQPNEEEFDVPGAYQVEFGRGTFAPNFTLFVKPDGSITDVEDVLEGGDADFFDDPQTQADYFNLINEIRRPGSTLKGKRLTLYTARPRRDRARYDDARTLPLNIFLSSSLNDAMGLARDFGGGEVRDVYRVRMDSRYLVNTLDSGSLRHYQTVGAAPVPVDSIERISSEDDSSAQRVARRWSARR